MKVLAFLQNQWFKNPDAARKTFARYPQRRREIIARYLFMGCITGRRIMKAFGGDLVDGIEFEEASPDIHGRSDAMVGADVHHIWQAIHEVQPDIVLCFGKVASNGVRSAIRLSPTPKQPCVIYGPHPAARFKDIMDRLRATAGELRKQQEAAA